MIISRGRNYIFVHAPKTGGTSMALALEARAMKDDLMLGDTPKARNRRKRLKGAPARGRLWKHSTLSDIDGVVAPDEVASMFCFTLVRNPWDRVVSYYHWLRVQEFDHPAVRRAQGLDFEAFVLDAHTLKSLASAPASHYMTDAAGVERCDLYIRLEHIEADIVPLSEHLGFSLSLPRVNVSKRDKDWRSYYSDQSEQAIREACAQDIVAFGYSFDPLS